MQQLYHLSQLGTYHTGDQRRLRRACASALSRQSLRCSYTWSMDWHIAPLDGCACAFEEWVYGGQKVWCTVRVKSLLSAWHVNYFTRHVNYFTCHTHTRLLTLIERLRNFVWAMLHLHITNQMYCYKIMSPPCKEIKDAWNCGPDKD